MNSSTTQKRKKTKNYFKIIMNIKIMRKHQRVQASQQGVLDQRIELNVSLAKETIIKKIALNGVRQLGKKLD